jgi:predicted lactoylglutathione lyase
MSFYSVVIALPTEDRSRAFRFAQALGFGTPGEPDEDGIPEPLRVQLSEQTALMYIPTGGFSWVTGGRPTTGAGSSECLISLQVETEAEVDEILGRVEGAGGGVASRPEPRSYGYTGTFTDPDGHLWEAIVSDI